MGIIDVYFSMQREYEEKYGPRTILLMQIGSFYEMYEYDPTLDVERGERTKVGHAVEVCDQLEFELSMQNKNKPYGYLNPNKGGFPVISYEREHRQRLLDHNWTIVRVDQRKIGKDIQRYVAEVASPATEASISTNTNVLTNYVVSIYIRCQEPAKSWENYLITCGVAAVDATTGVNVVSEFYSSDNDQFGALQEIYRFLIGKKPREILINIVDVDLSHRNKYNQFIYDVLELERYPIVIFRFDEIPPDYYKLTYQRQLLNKLFPQNVNGTRIVNNTIISDLDLEYMSYGRVSYICLINYCYEHNERVLTKITKPDTKWIDENHHLVLTHNAIIQLNIYPTHQTRYRHDISVTNRKPESLFEVINNTSTRMGCRRLQDLLYNPYTEVSQLTKSYDQVDEMLHDNQWRQVEGILKGIPDMERLHRTLLINNIKPPDLAKLFISYSKVVELFTYIYNHNVPNCQSVIPDQIYLNQFNEAIMLVWQNFNLEHLKHTKIEHDGEISFTEYPLLANRELYEELMNVRNYIVNMANYLNQFAEGGRGRNIEFRDDLRQKRGETGGLINTAMGFITSKTRAKLVMRAIDEGRVDLSTCGDITFDNVKDGTVVTSNTIKSYCQHYDNLKSQLKKQLYDHYIQTIEILSDKFDFYYSISRFIASIDVIKSHAKTSLKYRYFRPQLDVEDGSSYVEAHQLRHPLVERIISTEYIPNDISLGTPAAHLGILLYGANAAGKTTLAKSIVLNIIMAQMGGFTAGQLKFHPYYKIITRLTGNDDLIKGHSSFIVEMLEVRTIERNADQKTLVVGDELCRGTESMSGTCLTISTLETLVDRGSSFVFSTHMHHLIDMPEIQQLTSKALKICHLHIHHDQETDILIYDRKLKEGPGEDVYGIEIAKYLNFSHSYLQRSLEIRRRLKGEGTNFLSTKSSKYNSQVYVDNCELCNTSLSLETHHIQEQHNADTDGFIDHQHKNSAYNLMVLCNACHHSLHKHKQQIVVHQTINGKAIQTTE